MSCHANKPGHPATTHAMHREVVHRERASGREEVHRRVALRRRFVADTRAAQGHHQTLRQTGAGTPAHAGLAPVPLAAGSALFAGALLPAAAPSRARFEPWVQAYTKTSEPVAIRDVAVVVVRGGVETHFFSSSCFLSARK